MKSWIEVSAARLAQNLQAVREAVGPDVELLAVVKADGYGHGAAICAPVLCAAGAHWLGVTDAEEGVAVRAALAHSPEVRILVMCGMEPADAPSLVAHELSPIVWTVAHLQAMERAAQAAGRVVRVHLEVDTGMGRQGVALHEVPAMAAAIAASPWLACEGVMTHLACAEVAGSAATVAARGAFEQALKLTWAAGLHPEVVHMGNTSAVDEAGTTRWLAGVLAGSGSRQMVRTGVALYGYCLPMEGDLHPPALRSRLRPVMTWRAPIVGLREVDAGTPVGYGSTFVAATPMRLALLPVGYADGFRREASSGLGDGWVMLNGHRAPVVGRVSMNLTVVDVSNVEGVAVGDVAVLLGEGVGAEEHAHWARTIPYDILCGVRGRRVLT